MPRLGVPLVETNLGATGAWRLQIDNNGSTIVDAPFTVVSDPARIVNRPPGRITVRLDPPRPAALSDVLAKGMTRTGNRVSCRVRPLDGAAAGAAAMASAAP